ncbi:PQQ-like beta-propeller repeat protein [Thalassococcus arenae]|nr:PQQ-like beta-propeller repeat protein [Thalassococcus arenae]
MALFALIGLAACADRDPVLVGDRLGVRDVLESQGGADVIPENQSRAIALAAQQSNASWPQSAVSPAYRTDHAALGLPLQPLWSLSIGAGDSRRQRLNTDPVVADGRIYTMDAESQVRAVSTAGALLWSYDLIPLRDGVEQGQGGGLAFADGRLFVSSGFGTLTALDAASGQEIWTQRLGNTATGKPTVAGDLVYVVGGDSTGWAIEAGNGRIRWQIEGQGDSNNVAGGPAPAVDDDLVIFSFGEAFVQAAFRKGGLGRWGADILGRRTGVTVAGIDDITGDPLIDGSTVYVGNHSGRVVALSTGDGERLWTAKHGALGPVWPAGDSVFFVSDRNQLIRLDAATGEQIWAVDLPGYKPERRPQRRRDTAFAHHGPILAGGRLIVASSDGLLRYFDPTDGALAGQTPIDGGATTRPVVAGGTLYVVSKKGVLHAYR